MSTEKKMKDETNFVTTSTRSNERKKKAKRHLFWFILAHILVQSAKKEAEEAKKMLL
jgi:hypothetical protein